MSCSEDLAVMRNPFSTATISPKVPDGQANMSTGCRAQNAAQYEMNDNNKPSYIILSPGLQVMANCIFSNNGAWNHKVMSNLDTQVQWQRQAPQGGTVDELRRPIDMPCKWRIVSAGARVTLINNRLDDDGWFEAIRLRKPMSADHTVIYNIAAAQPNETVTGLPVKTVGRVITSLNIRQTPEVAIASATNWPENPSYITGKLKDINKHLFYLQTVNNDRKFTELESSYTNTTQDAAILGQEDNYPGFGGRIGVAQEAFVDANFDQNFDKIIIRIHANVGPTMPATIHLHTITNYEYVWDTDSSMAKFMTNCMNKADMVLKTDHAIKSDIKPTILRLPQPVKMTRSSTTPKRRTAKKTRSKTPTRRRRRY